MIARWPALRGPPVYSHLPYRTCVHACALLGPGTHSRARCPRTPLTPVFISELTCRAWLVAEGHKRRTLQKSDVASAIAFSDVFDFLIDIVPRDDGTEHTVPAAAASNHAEPEPAAAGHDAEWPRHDDEHEGDALYSEYVQGEGEGFA